MQAALPVPPPPWRSHGKALELGSGQYSPQPQLTPPQQTPPQPPPQPASPVPTLPEQIDSEKDSGLSPLPPPPRFRMAASPSFKVWG
jgi:hypothetical protein